MPPVRLSSRRGSGGRRKSSLAPLALAKPGTYGYTPAPASSLSAAVTFAPNVTPITYSAPSPEPSPFGSPSLATDQPLPLFPPSATPAPPPTRKRAPPGKRRSQGYIPRPPNAFMLFRADFVRQRHVPGSIETNHGSLSKIIGNCWRALPLAEKHIWEIKAKHAKAEHKLQYPDYKFRPVHTKRGPAPVTSNSDPSEPSASGSNAKGPLSPQEDERRCEEVAALLLQGKKGEELAWAIRDLDSRRRAELAQSESQSPISVPAQYPPNSKFPNPLNLDPMYYPDVPSSQPSASLTGSYTSSASGPSYSPPMRADNATRRRSSSVPLPNDYSYPFMYGNGAGTAEGEFAFSSIGFPPQSSASGFALPPPPGSADPLLATGGSDRLSFSWMGTGTGTGPNFAYPRPSFSFAGMAGGARKFSLAGAFGGWWGPNPNGPEHHAAAYGDHQHQHQHQPQQEEEALPDADTSLFDAGFLNSFGATSPVVDTFGAPDQQHQHQHQHQQMQMRMQQQIVHAPRPMHAAPAPAPPSPLEVEFAVPGQQRGYGAGAGAEEERQRYLDESYAAAAAAGYTSEAYSGVAPSYADAAGQGYADVQGQVQAQAHDAYLDPGFGFPAQEAVGYADAAAPSAYDVDMSAHAHAYGGYAAHEFSA
ncbi:HMG box domain-containing protein [Mycena venus]|uniref:HMG box domain-containing protein n=1 Tax=Mycena venus TaxID=2733690 RepID=A0A8H6Y8U5_9AGAR|nr:HMG box domain-containing protein [Mycena venus]